jgi:hypothetical protein
MSTEIFKENSEHKVSIFIDGIEYPVSHGFLSGREVLEIAKRHPVDDHLAYWLSEDNILKDLGLEGTVHLHEHKSYRFFTFNSDRSFRFEIEGKREDWGASFITEETLRSLSGVGSEFRVWMELKDQPDRLLERKEVVNLAEVGIERFRTERLYKVTVVNEDNGHEFPLEASSHTTITALIGVMYQKFNLTKKEDDRLRCEDGGGDVFSFGQLTIGQYAEAGHCRCLVWLFAGGTGGAAACL